MKKFILKGILFLFLALQTSNFSYALNVETHEDINEYIARNTLNGFSLGLYLKDNLGIENGITTSFNSLEVWQLLRNGGRYEDEPPWTIPYLRSVNHFHNPLTEQGFSGFVFDLFLSGDSSLRWAQWPQGTQNPGGYYSWHDVRNYYLKALASTDKVSRDTYFAQTFRGIGQLMHLVQDLSVPEHTRDDFHPSGGYEGWVSTNSEALVSASANPVFYNLSSLGQPNPLAQVPIANLFDTNQYNGSNPHITLNQNIGISEFANANFLSNSTIFTSNFSYPSRSGVELWVDETNSRQYLRKPSEGVPVNHLATVSSLYWYRQRYFPQYGEYLPIGLDPVVYQDYASLLLPRAVGYSAGLINYFFRGQMEVILVDGGLKVKNTGTEDMASIVSSDIKGGTTISGGIYIFYDYIDPKSGEAMRRLLTSYTLSTPLAPGDETQLISFAPPNDNIEPGRYIVVFYGRLGNEDGAVIGKITSPTKIYYISKIGGIYKIYKMETDGSNPTPVYDNPDPGLTIGKLAVSPDGATLAFTVPGPQIYLLDLTNNTLKKLTDGDWPSFSPDGKRIAFEREKGTYLSQNLSDVEIFIKEIETGIEAQITDIPGSSYSGMPAWSPDGKTIAYVRFNEPQEANCWNFYTINLLDISGNQKGSLTCTTEALYSDTAPSWSPDGSEITFTRRMGTQFNQLYKLGIGTKTITKLTDSTGKEYDEFTPSWSPDGNSIAIGSKRDGDFDIWLVNPNRGGYIKNLTNSNTDIDAYPAFGEGK